MRHFGLTNFFSNKRRLPTLRLLRKQAALCVKQLNDHARHLDRELNPLPLVEPGVWTMSRQMAETREVSPVYEAAADRINRLKVEFKTLQDHVTMYEVANVPRRMIFANLPLYFDVERRVDAINAVMLKIRQDLLSLAQQRLIDKIEAELSL